MSMSFPEQKLCVYCR